MSNVPGNAVLVFDAAGKRRDFRRPSNFANGHALEADGSVVEAESGDPTNHGRITRIASDGSVSVLADRFQGKHFNGPNDLIVKRDGTIWFTDPNFEQATGEILFPGVYRLDPKTKRVMLVTKSLSGPNGIAFSRDQKTLYVSDSSIASIFSFPVLADGKTVGRQHRFGLLGDGCDGIGVDEHGNVWSSTCDPFIVILDPAGKRIGQIKFPGTTSNLAWGGADGKTLFVTTGDGGVYSLALTVRETH